MAEHLRTPNIHVEPVTSRGEDKGGEKNDQGGGTGTQKSEEGKRETLEWSLQVTLTPTTQLKPCSG